MPADDLILNVRQIASYPPSAADPTDALLAQRGGLGGPYVSLDVAETVANALALGGGPLQVGVPAPGDAGPNGIFVNYVCSNLGLGIAFNAYHAFPDQWNYYSTAPAAAINLTAAGAIEFAVNPAGPGGSPIDWNVVGYLGPLGNMQIAGELTLGADPSGPMGAATAQWVEQVFAGLQASTVWSFNGRRGDIRLSLSDVIGAGGAPLFSPRFEGSPRAWTPEWCDNSTRLATTAWVQRHTVLSINHLLNDHPFVFSFNGRTGDVTLQPGDIQNAEAALLNSPPLTGTPTAPTAPAGTSTDQLATTQFVANAITAAGDVFAPIDSPAFTGYATAPTPAPGSSTAQIATTAFVMNAIINSTTGVASFNTRTGAVTLEPTDITDVGGALLNSPVFVGTPQAPTPAANDNSNKLATTAWVLNEIGGANVGVMTFNGRGGAVVLTGADLTAAGGALSASPALTGVPTAPTASSGTSTDQLATTAFVMSALGGGGAVTSFNGRAGAITLTTNDVSAAGGIVNPSPALLGAPTAPTAQPGTSSTQLATTAFVTAAIVAAGGVASFNGRSGAVTLTAADLATSSAGGPYLPTAGGTVTGTLNVGAAFNVNGVSTLTGVANIGPTGAVTAFTANGVNLAQSSAVPANASPQNLYVRALVGTPGTTVAYNAYWDGTNWRYMAAGTASYLSVASNGLSFLNFASGAVGAALGAATNGATIGPAGNLSLGGPLLSIPNAGSYLQLYQNCGVYSDATYTILAESGPASDTAQWRYLFTKATGLRSWVQAGGVSLMQLGPAGNLIIAGTLSQGSDVRGKRDIRPADEGLAQVRLMRPVRYRRVHPEPPRAHPGWRVPDHEEHGFVAQELRDALPDAVLQDDQGNLSVALMPLIATLTNAVRELDARLAKLGG